MVKQKFMIRSSLSNSLCFVLGWSEVGSFPFIRANFKCHAMLINGLLFPAFHKAQSVFLEIFFVLSYSGLPFSVRFNSGPFLSHLLQLLYSNYVE